MKKDRQIVYNKILCADFETTVYEGQTNTQVWSAAYVELYKNDVYVEKSIESFFERLYEIKENTLIYFHNIKFDGSFILYYLLNSKQYKQGYYGEKNNIKWKKDRELENGNMV